MVGDFDVELFKWINADAGKNMSSDRLAILFSQGGPYMLMLALIAFWLISEDGRKCVLLEAVEASVLGLAINQIIAFLYFHPRPYMVGLCLPLVPHAPETSFPSDHATLLFSAAIYLLLFGSWIRAGSFLLLIALLTAWGRVYSGIHFPLDMLGSFGVAILASCLTYWLKSCVRPLNELLIILYRRVLSVVYQNRSQ